MFMTALPLAALFLAVTGAVSSNDSYSVWIITEPSQGPFRLGQTVQLSCMIDPIPPDPVTYLWRAVEYGGVTGSRLGQNFNRTYDTYLEWLPLCYYYCEVLVNGTVMDSASTLVELQGIVCTEEPVTRSFVHDGYLELNVKICNYSGISEVSLMWYHNDTLIISGARRTLSNNNTQLTLRDMRDYDAGIYKVNFSRSCEFVPSIVLADNAPVVFVVQEHSLPTYNPYSRVPTYYITDDMDSIMLLNEFTGIQPNSSSPLFSSWNRNGATITENSMFNITLDGSATSTLQTSVYNITHDVTGTYAGITFLALNSRRQYYDCPIINYYLDLNSNLPLPIAMSIWNVKFYGPPSSVYLMFAEFSLVQTEHTVVECTAIGGQSPELFNFTLWRNDELLAQGSEDHLTYTTSPGSYGTYTCDVGGVQNSSVLQERVKFQLLLDGVNNIQCYQLMEDAYVHLMEGILATFISICPSCDNLSLDNIADPVLNCSTNQKRAYFTASVVYSSPDGQSTASTLTSALITWLLTQENPTLMVDGTAFALNNQCPTVYNKITEQACVNLLDSSLSLDSTVLIIIGFFAGLVAGVIIMILALALIACIRRIKASTDQLSETQTTVTPPDKSLEMTVSPNAAYVTVDARYQTGRLGQSSEVIYEVPAV